LKLLKNLLLHFNTKLSKNAERVAKEGVNTQKYQFYYISYSTDNQNQLQIFIITL